MKAWLKGGLIGVVIGLIWFFVGMFIGNNIKSCISTSEFVPHPACNLLIIFFIPVFFLGILGLSTSGIFIRIITIAITCFLIGALIGWLIGKRKKKH